MRHRSRSRNYDSNDNYKSRRSSPKYESSSRSHKSKVVHSHYSSDSRRHDSSKVKKSSDRSRYDHHRDRDSDSEDNKYDKKMDDYDRDCKKSKYSKYSHADSPVTKHSRKYDSYTHSYKRRSISSELSNHSYESKYRKTDEKSDNKRSYVKSTKESKRSRISRTPSSEELSDVKIKTENKDKVKDKKLKKKAKKSDKDKKKRKRQKHSSDEEIKDTDNTKRVEEKTKSCKHSELEDQELNKDKLKLEPFKVKESSNLKSQINFLNPSNIFTKDEWQKESSDDDLNKKETKKENSEPDVVKDVKLEKLSHEEIKDSSAKKSEENDCSEKDRNRKKRKNNQLKINENTKIPKPTEVDDEKSLLKINYENLPQKEKVYSHSKTSEQLKSTENKEKSKTKDLRISQKTIDDRKKVEDSFEDERIELPRSPTDAQYIGLFARLLEEPVSDTEIESILPPILLDDRMKALLINDPNVTQEAWDSEDDVLLSKRENIIAPKHRGVLETLAVPWKLLIDEASLNKNKEKTNSSGRFDVSNVVENIGVSRKLGGEILWKHCLGKFLNPIPPLHQTLISQKSRRNSIFCERGLFAGALSARKDLFIRRVLYEPMI